MHVNGQYVGLGVGIFPEPPDSSPEIAKIKAWLKQRFTPARTTLDDGPVFTKALAAEVERIQNIRVKEGKLKSSEFIPGVINLATKYAFGYLSKEKILPLFFSVEGHMSDMWIGPMAWLGSCLSAEGRALHFPTWYDRTSIPFKNKTGTDELARRIRQDIIFDEGMAAPVKFAPGTPFILGGFSQGAMITYEFWRDYLAPGKPLHWRMKDCRGILTAGNPYREKGVCAPWIPDPPPSDHQGLGDERMVNTPWWWIEIARKGDLYSDNESSGDRALFKTSIYKIIAHGKWWGGPAGFLSRVKDLLTPLDDAIPLALSIYDGMKFIGDMSPHGVYNMDPALQWCRDQLAAPPILELAR